MAKQERPSEQTLNTGEELAKARAARDETVGQDLIQAAQDELQKRLAQEIARIFGQ